MQAIKATIGNRSLLVYRLLTAAVAGLMLASFIMPWWTADVFSSAQGTFKDAIRIYGWGLQHNLISLRDYILQDETPFYHTILAWIYMTLSLLLIMFSTWLKGKKGTWLMGGVGLVYIVYVVVAVYVITAGRLAAYGFSLEGWNYFTQNYGTSAGIKASLRFGYYLSYIAGGTSILLASFQGILPENHNSMRKKHSGL